MAADAGRKHTGSEMQSCCIASTEFHEEKEVSRVMEVTMLWCMLM